MTSTDCVDNQRAPSRTLALRDSPRTFGLRLTAGLSTMALASGCSLARGPTFAPGGIIAAEERDLLYLAGGLMTLVLITIWVLTFVIIRNYNDANPRAPYRPSWLSSPAIEACCWGGPAIIILILGITVWRYTHALDPYKPLTVDNPVAQRDGTRTVGEPVRIQAISLDWKWVFLYENGMRATVNDVVIPVGAPIEFQLTSDGPMSAFMIQGLGGQIYAMAGMVTRMNLRADREGVYVGRNMQFTGDNFPHQWFHVKAVSPEAYRQWLATVGQSGRTLDQPTLDQIAVPDKKDGRYPVHHFASASPGLFKAMVNKNAPNPNGMHPDHGKSDSPLPAPEVGVVMPSE